MMTNRRAAHLLKHLHLKYDVVENQVDRSASSLKSKIYFLLILKFQTTFIIFVRLDYFKSSDTDAYICTSISLVQALEQIISFNPF